VPAHKPALAEVLYGPHERPHLDFYQAKSEGGLPVVFFILGGGWLNGDKCGFNN
jgi:acetyl esterase/lipase